VRAWIKANTPSSAPTPKPSSTKGS
jgi:hypothetical protein